MASPDERPVSPSSAGQYGTRLVWYSEGPIHHSQGRVIFYGFVPARSLGRVDHPDADGFDTGHAPATGAPLAPLAPEGAGMEARGESSQPGARSALATHR